MSRLKSCMHCGMVHEVDYICSQKQIKINRKKDTNSEIDIFRGKSKWKKKRAQIKSRDLGMCVVCRKIDGRVNTKVEAHHIVPMKEDKELWLEDSNLISLCEKHHTLAEDNKISRKILLKLINAE